MGQFSRDLYLSDWGPNTQRYAGSQGWYDHISPAGNTAHAIRVTRLVQVFAYLPGKGEEEIQDMRRWIEYQMGLGEVSPSLAGICTPKQQRALIGYWMTPGEMWSEQGIDTVSMKAPSSRFDGYCNGKVGMPHQGFLWIALIAAGEMDYAERIAQSATRVWKKVTDATFTNYEQFDGRTGQGEGCHQFPGLSGPAASFCHRYYTPGRLTAGYDTYIYRQSYDESTNTMDAEQLQPGLPGVIVVMDHPGKYPSSVNGLETQVVTHTGWINLKLQLSEQKNNLWIRED